jgi:hypothetical protein
LEDLEARLGAIEMLLDLLLSKLGVDDLRDELDALPAVQLRLQSPTEVLRRYEARLEVALSIAVDEQDGATGV